MNGAAGHDEAVLMAPEDTQSFRENPVFPPKFPVFGLAISVNARCWGQHSLARRKRSGAISTASAEEFGPIGLYVRCRRSGASCSKLMEILAMKKSLLALSCSEHSRHGRRHSPRSPSSGRSTSAGKPVGTKNKQVFDTAPAAGSLSVAMRTWAAGYALFAIEHRFSPDTAPMAGDGPGAADHHPVLGRLFLCRPAHAHWRRSRSVVNTPRHS